MCYYCVTYEHQSVTTLYSLPECQEAPCSKQVSYLKFKWQQRDSNPKLLRKRTLKPFSQTGQMIELCCEYLSVSCIWLFAIIMSRTIIRVNPDSIVYLNVKEILASNCFSNLQIKGSKFRCVTRGLCPKVGRDTVDSCGKKSSELCF